jgi:predicted membrane protein
MPRSSKSHRHKKPHPQTHESHPKKKSSSIPVFAIFLGALGAGIAFFATGPAVPWLIGGAAIGIIAGFLIGRRIDRQGEEK